MERCEWLVDDQCFSSRFVERHDRCFYATYVHAEHTDVHPTTFGLHPFSMTLGSSITVESNSSWLLTRNTFSVSNQSSPPMLFDRSSFVQIGSMSWVLWAVNNMSSSGGGNDTCVLFQAPLLIDSTGYMSFVDSNCTSTATMCRIARRQVAVRSDPFRLVARRAVGTCRESHNIISS